MFTVIWNVMSQSSSWCSWWMKQLLAVVRYQGSVTKTWRKLWICKSLFYILYWGRFYWLILNDKMMILKWSGNTCYQMVGRWSVIIWLWGAPQELSSAPCRAELLCHHLCFYNQIIFTAQMTNANETVLVEWWLMTNTSIFNFQSKCSAVLQWKDAVFVFKI